MRVVAAVYCVTIGTALAQSPADTFTQAEAKNAAGDRIAACALYEQALANEAQLPWKTAFLASTKLALCKKDANKLASAVALYRHAAEILHKNSSSADNRQRAQAAQKAGEELAAKLSHLTIEVAPDVAKLDGLRITLEGRVITEWNSPIEIDGGKYVVRASARGQRDFEDTVTVASEKDARSVKIAFAAAARNEEHKTEQPREETPEPEKRSYVPAIIAGGVALAAAGVAIGFELSAEGTYDKYATDPDHPAALLDQANRKRHIANGLAVGAGVAAAAGIALWLLWPASAETSKVAVSPLVSPDAAGAQAVLRW